MAQPKATTRIQQRNRALIQEAALEVFSTHGFRGATVDQIAQVSGLSKANLLYYFPSKETIFTTVLSDLLENWLDPLKELDPAGEPMVEIQAYVARKIQLSQDYPRESRLFANEILQGAPRMLDTLSGDLKALVDEKSQLLQNWMDQGKINKCHPKHLLFSIWALTQHYADFDIQVRALMGGEDPFDSAPVFLETLYARLLKPET